MSRPWVRTFAWWAFWMLVYALGMTQAWVFSDEPPKPPLVDVIGRLGIWPPMMAMFAPVFIAISWLTRVGFESYGHLIGWIGALGWSWMVSAAIVASEDRLFPNTPGRTTWIVLGATCASLVVLRLLARWDTDGFDILLVSSTILLFLVALAYGCVGLLLILKLSSAGAHRTNRNTN